MKVALQCHELSPGTERIIVTMHKAGESFAAIGRQLEIQYEKPGIVTKLHRSVFQLYTTADLQSSTIENDDT